MNLSLPAYVRDWASIQPFFQELIERSLEAETLPDWLKDWSDLRSLVFETYNRLYNASTCDTLNPEIQKRFGDYVDQVFPLAMSADQTLKEKLLASGLEPADFAAPLRNMRLEVSIYNSENQPLLAEELKLDFQYDQILSAQTVEWDGREATMQQLQRAYFETDRPRRERAWRLIASRRLADRQKLGELWQLFLAKRRQIAQNAGLSSYTEYCWRQLLRLDYTPDDCRRFHEAIEQVVVPVVMRLFQERQRQLGVSSLRPWDLDVDPLGRPPLRPFNSFTELEGKAGLIFARVHPQFGEYYQIMRKEGLLDLDNRKGKAPGAYSIEFSRVGRPVIFMNAVGTNDDVFTLLHEGGHAFHTFEANCLPYHHQQFVTNEMAEVASMSMELLASPYLRQDQGGFYTEADHKRARRLHLETILRFWPDMAAIDAFQHWAYENPDEAADVGHCSEMWRKLWLRFMPGVDWSGLEDCLKMGWMYQTHIFKDPFYFVEYGIAQLGALQIYRNSIKDREAAVAAYRQFLRLGGTRSLPELFAAAGARFAFDADALKEAVDLIEEEMASLRD